MTACTRSTAVAEGGRRIAFTVRGRGRPTLILIHGWACHQGFWCHPAVDLGSNATVVTVDLAGHGSSSPSDPARPVSIDGLARDVVAVADALSLPDVILVGHSMGGPVAVEAAILMADRCRLVLGVDSFTDASFYRRRSRQEITARRRAFETDFTGAVSAMVRRITLGGGPAVADWIASEMGRRPPATALAHLDALLDWDIEARWPLLPCPAETINSAVLSRGIETVPNLRGLQVHEMDRVGHFPMLEDPVRFSGLVGEIVRRHG